MSFQTMDQRVKEFFARKRRNLERAKGFSRTKVLAALPKDAEFELPPFTHQAVCFLLCMKYKTLFLQANMGLGKTKVMLDVFRYRIKKGVSKRMLVVVPFSANVPTWEDEIEKHTPELSHIGFHSGVKVPGTRKMNHLAGQGQPSTKDIVIFTYAGLLSLMKGPNAFLRIAGQFDTLVCDESDAFRNPVSKTFRMLRRLSKEIPYRYCLSGTPFSVNPIGLWPQFYICDQGETLHEQFGVFRESMFRRQTKYIGFDWVLPEKNEQKLAQLCKNRAIRYGDEECVDLPKLSGGIDNPVFLRVKETQEQARAASGLLEDMRRADADGDTAEVNAVYYKSRAVCSGYLPLAEKQFVDFASSPKMDRLIACLHELGGAKAIVYYYYSHTGLLLRKALAREQFSFAEIHGNVSNKANQLAHFRHEKQLLLGSDAAAVGLNLQFCHNTFYFETPDKVNIRLQGEKRTHRTGQTAKVVRCTDIIVKGSIEERIYAALKARSRVLTAILDGGN